MGRFYKTSQTDFSSLGEGASRSRPSGRTQKSALGEMSVLPEDAVAFQDHVSQYQAEMEDIARQVQANPNDTAKYQPVIQKLQQKIAKDAQGGPMRAFKERYTQYSEIKKGINDVHKDNPYIAQKRISEIEINPFNYDSDTGDFSKIGSPKTWDKFSDKDMMTWQKTAMSSLEDKILKEADAKGIKISPTQTVYEMGNVIGMNQADIEAALIGQVPEHAQQYFKQRNSDYDLGRDEELMVDGKLNTNSTFGRNIRGMSIGKAKSKFDGSRVTGTDKFAESDRNTANAIRKYNATTGRGGNGDTSSDSYFIYNAMNGVMGGTADPESLKEGFKALKTEGGTRYFKDGGKLMVEYEELTEKGKRIMETEINSKGVEEIKKDANGGGIYQPKVVKEVDSAWIYGHAHSKPTAQKILNLLGKEGLRDSETLQITYPDNGQDLPEPEPEKPLGFLGRTTSTKPKGWKTD